MRGFFSRRALYRHRANHMIYGPSPAARPVPFPHAGSTLKKLKWLQGEVEHSAALAGYKGDLSLQLKAFHELGRLLWLEARLSQGAPRQPAFDVTDLLPPEEKGNTEEARRLTQESRESEEGESDLDRALRLSRGPTRQHEIGNRFNPDDPSSDDGGV